MNYWYWLSVLLAGIVMLAIVFTGFAVGVDYYLNPDEEAD